MDDVMLTCPETGELVWTGHEATPERFDLLVLEDEQLDCPACGGVHTYSKRDTVLATRDIP
jgi:hypothetical protein